MIKKQKLKIILSTIIGGAAFSTTSAITLASCSNTKNDNINNDNGNDLGGGDNIGGNVDGDGGNNDGGNPNPDGNGNQNYFLTLDYDNSKRIYNILETCITPKANISLNDLNNSYVKNQISNNLSSILNIPTTVIKNITFIETQSPFYNVSVTFKDNVIFSVTDNTYFVYSNNTITTKSPINYGLISINSSTSQDLYTCIQNYFNSNNNETYEDVLTGKKYDSFVESINNVLSNVLNASKTIENVDFNLSNNNSKINVSITFNTPIDLETFDNTYFSISPTNDKCIQTINPISVNLFTKINNSRINLNVDRMTQLFLLVLSNFSNNYLDFVDLIQQKDNLKKLLIKSQSEITTMSQEYINSIVGCSAILKNNDNANFIIKFNNNSLGGNVYVEFNTNLNNTSETFIFNDNQTKLLGLTSFAKQNSSFDLSSYTKLIEIVDNSFENCTNLTNITLPTNITKIGNNVFRNCSKLNTINLQSINSLGTSVFENCTNLTNVQLGNSLTIIPNNSFKNCTNLSSINLNNISEIGQSAFSNSGLTSIDLTHVSKLNNESFANCKKLNVVNMENSKITSIPSRCFVGSISLKTVSLSNNTTTIENSAFMSTSLTTIDLTHITSIGESAFQTCSRLSSITLGNAISIIPNNCFNGCKSLTNISLNSNITTIGSGAFMDSGITNINLTNITSIGSSTFQNCKVLNNVVLGNSLTSIPNNCFKNCTTLTTITLTNNLITIEQDAFNGSGLTSIDLSYVTNLGIRAFYNCKSLTNITLSNSLKSIPQYCFKYCTKLVNIALPSTLITIGDESFFGCDQLINIYFNNGTSLETIGSNSIPNNVVFYVNNTDKTSLEKIKKLFPGHIVNELNSMTNP